MSFREFFELYKRDRKPRIRENTWRTKEAIVNQKILPYIGDLMLNEISNVTIIQWQNELMKIKDKNGKNYSPTYLRTIHAQLSSILNHACRYYNLKTNVARDVGSMGEKEADEMLFWTQDEYERFIEAIKDKPESFYAFELLYWCGLRMGELLALTKEKFDFERHTLKIDESLQRIDGKNVITAPKTKKSIRTIVMPEFLAYEIKEYIDSFYKKNPNDKIYKMINKKDIESYEKSYSEVEVFVKQFPHLKKLVVNGLKQGDNKALFKSLNNHSKNLQLEMQTIATRHDEMKVKYEELEKLKLNIDKFIMKYDEPKKSIDKAIVKKQDDKKTSINNQIKKEIER